MTYVDYKDVNLLQRFVSDRSKIRARRVSGNDVQQQREVATAIKNAREMALLPYTKRVATRRSLLRPRRPGLRGRAGRSGRRFEDVVVEETVVEEVLDDGSVEVEAEVEEVEASVAKVILRADVDGVGKRATSARCRTATHATSCSLEGWPSRRATAR